MTRPYLLALETSSSSGSLCLYDGTDASTCKQWEGGTRSGALFESLAETLADPQIHLAAVAVGLGPGSFTGIRVGIAVAESIRMARGCPVIGVPSSDAVARRHANAARLGVFADARRGEYYLTVYAAGALQHPTCVVPVAALDAALADLSLAVSADPLNGIPETCPPDARDLAAIAWDKWNERPDSDGPPLEPIYLRSPVPGHGAGQ